MANLPLKKEEDVFATFQSLLVEETRLAEEKEDLTIKLFQLETKFREKVKKMKQTVDSLNSEIMDLVEKCNNLRLWINEGSTLECSQATRPEDKDGDVKEPYDVKVIAAIPEGVPATPTENQSRRADSKFSYTTLERLQRKLTRNES